MAIYNKCKGEQKSTNKGAIFFFFFKKYIFHRKSNAQESMKNLISSVQFSSVPQSCLALWDPMDCSTPGFPVHHQLPQFTQTHVH